MLPDLHTVFLPVVSKSIPAPIGVQLEDHIKDLEDCVIPNRLYHMPIRWNDVEQVRGVYNIPAKLFEDAGKIEPNGWILGTKTTPQWARMWVNHLGSPPKEEYWKDYANFISASVTALAPWGVEIWNEPDTQPRHAEEEFYGAWIQDYGDAYEAGAYYGRFTAFIYPIIKEAHPEVSIVVGALMGNMDFLQGAVDAELTGDFLSLHKYIKAREEFGSVFEKVNEARAIVGGMPVIVTETSVLGDGSPEHQQLQADYVAYLREMQPWEGVPIILWYSMANYWWFNNALVVDGVKTPAYVEWAR